MAKAKERKLPRPAAYGKAEKVKTYSPDPMPKREGSTAKKAAKKDAKK